MSALLALEAAGALENLVLVGLRVDGIVRVGLWVLLWRG